MFKHLNVSLHGFDFRKLGKNIVGAILTPAATVFATTGDVAKAQQAGLLGVGAAALIVLGFIQQPYKTVEGTPPIPVPEQNAPTNGIPCKERCAEKETEKEDGKGGRG